MAEELYLICPNEAGRGLQKFHFTFDGPQSVGPGYRVRPGRDGQKAPVVQKIMLSHRDGADGILGREVSIGRTLTRRIGQKEYPTCLSRLIGYNPGVSHIPGASNDQPDDTARPNNMAQLDDRAYAVFTYQRGTLADLSGDLPLSPDLFWRIADGLIIALCYLQSAQVVHRRIRPETVRWDGEHVQLADFTHAAAEWDSHPGALGEAPWDAPEQLSGAATADCRDDVYAAALLLARLATGQEFADYADARKAIGHLDLGQRTLLGPACAERRRDRPTALELRRLRRLPDPLNAVQRGHHARESEARARFTRLRAQQERAQAEAAARAARSARPRPAPPPDPGGFRGPPANASFVRQAAWPRTLIAVNPRDAMVIVAVAAVIVVVVLFVFVVVRGIL